MSKQSEFRKLSTIELLLFLICFIIGPFVFTMPNILLSMAYCVILLVLIIVLNTLDRIKRKESRLLPLYYRMIIKILTLSYILGILLIILNDSNLYKYIMIPVIFGYLYVGGMILYYLINFFYVLLLRRVFPFEKLIKKEYKIANTSLKKLSRYIDSGDQHKYLTLYILNWCLYMSIVCFFMLLVYKHFPFPNFYENKGLSSWINRQSYITFFNLVSLISLTVTIYTVTIPTLKKIIDNARKSYNEENEKWK
jgi:O-antigen/teichoic acid export membrane protein